MKYLGPYEAWNFGVGKPYAFPPFRRSDIRYQTALAEFPKPTWIGPDPDTVLGSGHELRLPTIWGKDENIPLRFWPIVVENKAGADASPDSLGRDLMQAVQGRTIEEPRYRLAFPVSDSAIYEEIDDWPFAPNWSADPQVKKNCPPGKTIHVLAVIDDGIPFAHRNFMAADGKRSRMEFCWLQSADKDPDADRPSVLFGREYMRSDIERLIRDHGDDEDMLYRVAGASSESFELGPAINKLATHGAHIMDVAAGYDPNKPQNAPEETRLVAVQLPNTIAWDTSGFGKDMYMLSAVHYILERAERIAAGYDVADMRVVINFSYGFSGGRHDGASELEAAINEIVSERRKRGRPTAIVLPAGNTFMDRLHGEIASGDFKDRKFKFTWAVQPNDRTSSYLEIWFPQDFVPADYTIKVKAPFKQATTKMELKPDPENTGGDPRKFEIIGLDGLGETVPIGQISLDNHRSNGRWRVLVALAPTEPDDMKLPAAPAGDWSVTLKRKHDPVGEHGSIYLWVQRDADPDEFRSGSRQSYLRDRNYRGFRDQGDVAQSDDGASYVRRFGTVNGLATGSTSLIVSGCMPSAANAWDPEQPVPSHYSSSGKVSEDNPVGTVDCTAQSDRSSVLPGMIGAGTRSGSYAVVQGTSVAAPLVARRLSEAFAISSQEEVGKAEKGNYLSLLKKVDLPEGDGKIFARLGRYLII
ncbi:hypothetical protein OA90_00925 [Labrenzia sp. OB1]|nr:hypothetical protein OA90_00925 [Labrenzia sp. OB1]